MADSLLIANRLASGNVAVHRRLTRVIEDRRQLPMAVWADPPRCPWSYYDLLHSGPLDSRGLMQAIVDGFCAASLRSSRHRDIRFIGICQTKRALLSYEKRWALFPASTLALRRLDFVNQVGAQIATAAAPFRSRP